MDREIQSQLDESSTTQGQRRRNSCTSQAEGDGEIALSVALYMDHHVPAAITSGLRVNRSFPCPAAAILASHGSWRRTPR
jgi:hypothetical protein